jgi:hypothetical protein
VKLHPFVITVVVTYFGGFAEGSLPCERLAQVHNPTAASKGFYAYPCPKGRNFKVDIKGYLTLVHVVSRIGRLFRLGRTPVFRQRIGRLYPLRMYGTRDWDGYKGEGEVKD